MPCQRLASAAQSRMIKLGHAVASTSNHQIFGIAVVDVERSRQIVPELRLLISRKVNVENPVHVLANELRGRGITVKAIAPGTLLTELFLACKSDELISQIAEQAPMARIGQCEGFSSVVSFVTGPRRRLGELTSHSR